MLPQIHFGEGMSSCRISQRSPLERMDFWVYLRPQNVPASSLNIDAPGTVVHTTLYDTGRKKEYTFAKDSRYFHSKVGNVELDWGKYKAYYWDELRKSDLLPLEHLSPEARQTLRAHTPKSKDNGIDTRGCLNIAEAIVNNPPSGFTGKGWILDFHRSKDSEMEKVLSHLKELHDEDEKKGRK
ncbi:hypothetical protein FOZ63_011496 [Perkinsus olseni]|uniref:Uncharacterized protein n=1 Tax=Perkinsus olseni TaxID=32597 RepID=A0A7J6SH27_PEROL|nr:hypothetical protein FOZ63_011496 [Perkinsus olseni]